MGGCQEKMQEVISALSTHTFAPDTLSPQRLAVVPADHIKGVVLAEDRLAFDTLDFSLPPLKVRNSGH